MDDKQNCSAAIENEGPFPGYCRLLAETGFGYLSVIGGRAIAGGKIQEWNENALKILGFKAEDLDGARFERILSDPDELSRLSSEISKCSSLRGQILAVKHKKGHKIFIEAFIHKRGGPDEETVSVLFIDRGMAKESILGILEDTGNAYYQTDLHDTTMFATRTEADMLGFESAEEVLGTNRRRYYRDEDGRTHFIRALDESGGKVVDYECQFVNRTTEEELSVITTSRYITDASGRRIGIEGMFRRAMLESFIDYVAHELGHPLSIMVAAIHNLKKDLESPESRATTIDRMFFQIRRLNRQIDRLAKLRLLETRELRPQRQSVNINELIVECWKELLPLAEENAITITVDDDIKHKKDVLQYDRELLKIMILNLLENAIKYSIRGSYVRVLSKSDRGRPRIGFGSRWIEITDKEKDLMFRKFWRSKRAVEKSPSGSGLGLYLVSKIIELCGGSIDVTSIPVPGAGPGEYLNTFELCVG